MCCAFLIASSIAGKISSPLRRTVIALPSVKWTPTRHSKERRNCRRMSSDASDVARLSSKVVRLLPVQDFPCTLGILGSKVPGPRTNDRTADPGVTRLHGGLRSPPMPAPLSRTSPAGATASAATGSRAG